MSKKINSLLLVMVILNAQTFAMQITEPYEARNVSSPIVKVGKSLLVAGGTCVLGACVQQALDNPVSLISLVGLGVVGGLAGYTYYECNKSNECNKQDLIDVLLTNPTEGLNSIYATNENFCTEGQQAGLENEKDVVKVIENYGLLIKKYEKKNPLFLLGECTQNGFFACVFTRGLNPSYRKRFEERVSQKLIEKIALNNQDGSPISYTSFGCGGAFSEVIILAKALAKKPNAHLTIHLIEGNNIPYVGAVDFLGFSREIKRNQKSFNFGDKLSEYRQFMASKGETLECTDNELHIQLVSNCIRIQKKNEQILTWLTNTFPNAKLSLFVHSFTDSYCDYLDKHKLPYADVVSTADIQDEISYMRGSVDNYAKLCTKTLEKKPNACNLWLAKDSYKQVSINSLSLTNLPGAVEEEVNGRPLYILVEKI